MSLGVRWPQKNLEAHVMWPQNADVPGHRKAASQWTNLEEAKVHNGVARWSVRCNHK